MEKPDDLYQQVVLIKKPLKTKKMYRKQQPDKTTLVINKSYIGETIEQKIEKMINSKEPISDATPVIYTERKDGVLPEYDIRTDRWDVAIDAMDKVSKTHIAKREERIKEKEEKKAEKDKPTNSGAESIQATE